MAAEPVRATAKVTLPLEPAVAEMLLRDEALRARVGRLLSRPSGIAAADLAAGLRSAHAYDGSKPTDGA